MTRTKYDLVDHLEQEHHPVDQLIQRSPRLRALRERVRKATKDVEKTLQRREEWIHLEQACHQR